MDINELYMIPNNPELNERLDKITLLKETIDSYRPLKKWGMDCYSA